MFDFSCFKQIMGGTSSSPRKCGHGCWKFRKHYSIEDENGVNPKKNEQNSVKRPRKLTKLRLNSTTSNPQYGEIPTPSVIESHWTSEDLSPFPPTQEKLMQIISCFPFPTPRGSTSTTPSGGSEGQHCTENGCHFEEKAFSSAFGKLVQVSVETMAITALPMDVWLRERLKKWVQLSGHEGSIVPASCQTLYKKQPSGSCEAQAYEAIMNDNILEGYTPKYLKEIQKNDECFIEIEDLLQQFSDPAKTAIMDIKVGCRTFLESEVTNTKQRPDLYQKMIAIDPNEPTEEEKERGSITKLRYMQFRERESSSAQMGFRIEAAKMPGGSLQKNFKKVRSSGDVTKALIDFFGADRTRVRAQILYKLKQMRTAIQNSEFFKHHEVVGSSLLIVHDAEKVGVWMIDFAKSHRVPEREMDHRSAWIVGNHEDGYLVGIDNIIEILEDMPPMGGFPDEEIPR